MVNNESTNDQNGLRQFDEIPKLVKWLYALVLFGAAIIIFILFEKIAPINIYLVYSSLGIIIGLGLILVLHLILRRKPLH